MIEIIIHYVIQFLLIKNEYCNASYSVTNSNINL